MSNDHQKPDSTSESPTKHDRSESAEFPVARIRKSSNVGSLLQSRMWWLTLICLSLAMWLTWSSLPERGTEITIRFPEGHGLKVGDAVRYRGIDVGSVTAVALNGALSGVDVRVVLKPEGGQLNRQGTRFWIVRPEISLTKVAGLETAVGAKYIGVSPDLTTSTSADSFDGLAAAPADELSSGGISLVLRSDNRSGLNAGAPVTWRGVIVGQVLSVSLSPDARHVLTSIQIDRGYKALVRSSSKFWITSGFGVDVSLSGLKLNAQSLATIARGGVSFITTADGRNEPVTDGHVFPLAASRNDEWLESAANLPLIDFPLPKTVAIRYEQSTTLLGIPRTREMTQVGLLVTVDGQPKVLTPMVSLGAGQTGVALSIQSGAERVEVDPVRIDKVDFAENDLIRVELPANSLPGMLSAAALRTPTQLEECLLVRSAGSEQDTVSLIHLLPTDQLMEANGLWQVTSIKDDLTSWLGAPAVSLADGKVIGILVIADSGPGIAPYTNDWKTVEIPGAE